MIVSPKMRDKLCGILPKGVTPASFAPKVVEQAMHPPIIEA